MSTLRAVRDYLRAVYPAAAPSLANSPAHELISLFESLDYYYEVDSSRGERMSPGVKFANLSGTPVPPRLPYVPPGVWFDASASKTRDWISAGDFLRYRAPVRVILMNSSLTPSGFYSSSGSRRGPQPTWTNPMALTRYVWWPIGFSDGVVRPNTTKDGRPLRDLKHGARVMHLPLDDLYSGPLGSPGGRDGRLRRLFALVSGDFVEVEHFGGPAQDYEVPGSWSNIWRGTGVFLRVHSPFVTLHKGSAIVDLLLELDARGEELVEKYAQILGAQPSFRKVHTRMLELLRRFSDARPGEALASALLFSGLPERQEGPCVHTGNYEQLQRRFAGLRWVQRALANQMHPRDVVARVLLRGPPNEPDMNVIHFLYGACGLGAYVNDDTSANLGWDGMIASLACVLGVKTVRSAP